MAVLKGRMKKFARAVPRLHVLRRLRFRTDQMARAAGTTAITYGVEVVGMADTHLQTARNIIARAAAASATGRSTDIALFMSDLRSGTSDPAFQAHIGPLRAWASAWWEAWQPWGVLARAFHCAKLKLNRAARSPWDSTRTAVAGGGRPRATGAAQVGLTAG